MLVMIVKAKKDTHTKKEKMMWFEEPFTIA